MMSPYSGTSFIVSEWIQNCDIQFLYSAGDGRIFWLPEAIWGGIRQLSAAFLLPGLPVVTRSASRML